MIVYSASRAEFTDDVFSNVIEQKVLAAFQTKIGHKPGKSEITSWKNSLQYMNNVVVSAGLPEDVGVAIEYRIPTTSNRVDVILTGEDSDHQDTVVIVELKQWSDVRPTRKDAIVETFVGKANREMLHPSYQAWTYAALIEDFNEPVKTENIQIKPCAYLHNCDSAAIHAAHYRLHTNLAPAFLRSDVELLRDFLRRHVRYGDRSKILYRIENGKLRPSKGLVDHLLSLLQGNKDFQLIDDQKIVYETALELV